MMQFHRDGFREGDPDLMPSPDVLSSDEIDVLIVGAGPAGLTLAAYLAGFPEFRTLIVEQKSGPMRLGQADGISCRSMEMFNCFGFAERVMREAYWVNESVFWKPDPSDPSRIARSGRVQDVEDGLSEMPHVILNQARVHDMYLDVMRASPTRLEPAYGRRFLDLSYDASNPNALVDVTLAQCDREGNERAETLRARYVVGCEGARSRVRSAIGQTLRGDSANRAWGVMDVLAVTDFPDIRFKCLIQSSSEGSLLIIPREGGYLVRLYVELDELNENERAANRDLTIDHLVAAANRIFAPYSIDVKEVAWWSIYEIGQRLTERFDDLKGDAEPTRLPRVFIAGDACHTHSPKAGQGMNVSMGDAFNLGWKLASVLNGRAKPEILRSYSTERRAVAQALIDFDRKLARIISAPPDERETDGKRLPGFQDYFVEHGRYTAGLTVRYSQSMLTGSGKWQHLAQGFEIGMRFHSAPAVRLADGKPVQLGHVQKADARWLVLAFAGGQHARDQISSLRRLCEALYSDPASPLLSYAEDSEDIDAQFDLRAVLQVHHHEIQITDLPTALLPATGRLGLLDYEKVFCADHRGDRDIFDMRGVDRDAGCLVVVRPDQYVATILPLNGTAELGEFLAGIFLPAEQRSNINDAVASRIKAHD